VLAGQDRNFTSSSQRNIPGGDYQTTKERLCGPTTYPSDDLILPEISSKNGGSLSIQELAVNN
jgi:hypothetical protein